MEGSDLLVVEERLPIAARWTLYALGSVEGQRVRRPRDPVAAWLLRRHPQLLPTFAAPSVLSMIRARASVIDQMIACEVHRARLAGERLRYHGLGGGFDARWYRLRRGMHDVIASHREVEEPEVLRLKDRLLATSTFAQSWKEVVQTGESRDAWRIAPDGATRDLVVLEGVADRLGPEGLLDLLRRLRSEAPRARVLLDLPGFLGKQPPTDTHGHVGRPRARWVGATRTGANRVRTHELTAVGYQVWEDVWLGARPELRAPSGMTICSGSEALRVVRLHPVS